MDYSTLLNKILSNSIYDENIRKKFYVNYNGRNSIIIHNTNYHLISSPHGEMEISDMDLSLPIIIVGIKRILHERLLQNIRILRCKNLDLSIGKSEIQGITIVDCETNNLTIENSIIGTFGINIHNDDTSNATKEIRVECSEIKGTIFIRDLIKIKYFTITRTNFTLEEKEHIEAKRHHNIIIDKAYIETTKINNLTKIPNGICFTSSSFENIIINDIGGVCEIKQLNFFNILNIKNLYINKIRSENINFVYCKNIEYGYFNNIDFLEITDTACKYIENIDVPKIIKTKIELAKTENSSIEVTESCFEKFHLCNIQNGRSFTINQSSILSGSSLKQVHFDVLSFRDILLQNSTLFLDGLTCREITFKNFTNLGILHLKNISSQEGTADNLLRIHDSDLGITHFINCNLEEGWMYDFKNSIIISIQIVASKFPVKPINKDSWQIRLLHSQLYKIYENAGSRIRAIDNQRLSLEAYLNYLNENLQSKNIVKIWWINFLKIIICKQWFNSSFSCLTKRISIFLEQNREKHENVNESNEDVLKKIWDYWSLSLHKWSSYFDYKLNKAVLNLFCISSILYTLYIISLCHFTFSCNSWDDFLRFVNLFAHYFIFLSPIHESSFIRKYNSEMVILANPFAILIDCISKIIITYLIYQMVQSFRKFGRK